MGPSHSRMPGAVYVRGPRGAVPRAAGLRAALRREVARASLPARRARGQVLSDFALPTKEFSEGGRDRVAADVVHQDEGAA